MKYSIDEIERMRAAVRTLTIQYGTCYHLGQLDERVEQRLRTFMMNETTVEELETLAVARHREMSNRAGEIQWG